MLNYLLGEWFFENKLFFVNFDSEIPIECSKEDYKIWMKEIRRRCVDDKITLIKSLSDQIKGWLEKLSKDDTDHLNSKGKLKEGDLAAQLVETCILREQYLNHIKVLETTIKIANSKLTSQSAWRHPFIHCFTINFMISENQVAYVISQFT